MGDDFYKRACEIVKDKFDEYTKAEPKTNKGSKSTSSKRTTAEKDELLLALGSPVKQACDAPTEDLEWNRWCSGEGGHNLRDPLSWWRVRDSP